jgi:peptidyl-prolyl cis-trans isomerase C
MSKSRTIVEVVLVLALAGTLGLLAYRGAEASSTTTKSPPYVTVNGYSIPQFTADAFIEELKARGATDSPELQNAVREEMIRRAMLISEGKKLGLDKTTEYKQQIELAGQLLLMRNTVADYLGKHPVSAEELQRAYDETIARLGKTEYKIRHILVKTEAKAKSIVAQLGEGKDFAEAAKESSIDATTKDKGGLLGWRSPYNLPIPVGAAVRDLKKGEYTKTPMQDQAGFQVIYVEDTRPLTPPNVEELKPALTQALAQQKTMKYIADLREKATIK